MNPAFVGRPQRAAISDVEPHQPFHGLRLYSIALDQQFAEPSLGARMALAGRQRQPARALKRVHAQLVGV